MYTSGLLASPKQIEHYSTTSFTNFKILLPIPRHPSPLFPRRLPRNRYLSTSSSICLLLSVHLPLYLLSPPSPTSQPSLSYSLFICLLLLLHLPHPLLCFSPFLYLKAQNDPLKFKFCLFRHLGFQLFDQNRRYKHFHFL